MLNRNRIIADWTIRNITRLVEFDVVRLATAESSFDDEDVGRTFSSRELLIRAFARLLPRACIRLSLAYWLILALALGLVCFLDLVCSGKHTHKLEYILKTV